MDSPCPSCSVKILTCDTIHTISGGARMLRLFRAAPSVPSCSVCSEPLRLFRAAPHKTAVYDTLLEDGSFPASLRFAPDGIITWRIANGKLKFLLLSLRFGFGFPAEIRRKTVVSACSGKIKLALNIPVNHSGNGCCQQDRNHARIKFLLLFSPAFDF
jgi:hypothetical protein